MQPIRSFPRQTHKTDDPRIEVILVSVTSVHRYAVATITCKPHDGSGA